MAGERKGKAYEAVVLVALEELRDTGVFHYPIYWEKMPAGMTIKPDLTIGPSEDAPLYSILVTHCSSPKNSDMKGWRNLGELVETKTCLTNVPKVFSLTFGAIKEDLEPIQAWAFDEFRWARGERWHAELDALVNTLTQAKNTTTSSFPDEVRQRNPRQILDPLKAVLLEFFRASERRQMVGLWNLHRRRPIPLASSSRPTHVRRGLAKLAIFEDVELGAKIHDGKRVSKNQIPSYAFELCLAQKSTCEAWGIDPDIESAINCLGVNEAIQLARQSVQPQMYEWYYTLRNRSLIPHFVSYITAHYAELQDPKWLAERLAQLYKNPAALLPCPSGLPAWPPPTVWLFEMIMQLIRASTGSGNGYGYAQLINDILNRFGGRLKGGGEPSKFRFALPDWVHRRDRVEFTASELSHIASVLSQRLSKIPTAKAKNYLADLAEGNAKHILEQKLIPYRMFDPLGDLLHSRIPGFKELGLDVCYREAAGINGQAGRMVIGQARNTLINWQSCTDKGRDHKKKELCGRAVGVRYHWNGSVFVRRPGVEKLILLLDGTWRDGDLKALLRAGWDEIYYPDEMDRLLEAIV